MTLSSRLFLALSIAPLLVAQTKYQTDLTSMSPLGFWSFNNTPNDQSGHGNTGAASMGMSFSSNLTSPVEPNLLPFNGGSEVFAVPPNALYNLSALQPMTLTAWIKTDAQGLGSMVIMGKFDPKTNTGFALLVDNGDNGAPMNGGRLAFALFAAGTPLVLVESTNPVNDGRWRMVTATYDGSGSASGVHLYIDGNNATTTTLASAAGGSILNTAPLTIGNAADGSDPFEASADQRFLELPSLRHRSCSSRPTLTRPERFWGSLLWRRLVFGDLLRQRQPEPSLLYCKFHRRRWEAPERPRDERQFRNSHSCSGS